MLLATMASRLDPIAGGRHKVWGSVALCVPPQTSTIASQLPKAVGAAIAVERVKRLRAALGVSIRPQCFERPVDDADEIWPGRQAEPPPDDSIVLCSFGDASVNHSVAQGAFNTASWAAFQNVPVPILFVCEDNDIGISVRTPTGWVEDAFRSRPQIRYIAASGLHLPQAFAAAAEAVEYVRHTRRPAFLHFHVVRLMGHAGSDVETEYRTTAELEAVEARDPLLATARLMIDAGFMNAEQVLELYESVRQRVQAAADALRGAPQLESAEDVIAPLAPLHPDAVHAEAVRPAPRDARLAAFGGEAALPETQSPRHMAVLINRGLHDLLAKYPEMLIFGEDVAAKGGVYHVTTGLTQRFGVGRVFNTLLDETSILGLSIGTAHLGLLPVPEIQYLAYLHNAIDQLRGEACSTQYFSRGQYRNPLVVRIASLAYQKGFGGHFHNDNSIAALRDIPGLIVCVPSRGDDAVSMLRTCMALAKVDGRVVVFLEPIALYMTKDLHDSGDGRWQFAYPSPDEAVPLGAGRVYAADRDDLTILTYGNGAYMSLRAARTLEREHGIAPRIVDLRWLNPLNEDFIVEQAQASGRVLVVDEGRRTGGVGEALLAILMERCGGRVQAQRVAGHDTYIPLGPAANHVLPVEADIVAAATALVPRRRTERPARARS
jgi:2-oxoisovalerate dehydrogenase E1 component